MGSETEVAKYKSIATSSKDHKDEPTSNTEAIAVALTTVAGYGNASWDPLKDDTIDAKDCLTLDVEIDTTDVFFEEQSALAPHEEEENGDEERSLWGDGEKEPGEAEE